MDLGAFTGLRKNKIADPKSVHYLRRYIEEANYGVVIHVACIFVGFLVMFFYPIKTWLFIGLPVGVVNAFLNLLPLAVLRYNLPKLHKLLSINEKRLIQK